MTCLPRHPARTTSGHALQDDLSTRQTAARSLVHPQLSPVLTSPVQFVSGTRLSPRQSLTLATRFTARPSAVLQTSSLLDPMLQRSSRLVPTTVQATASMVPDRLAHHSRSVQRRSVLSPTASQSTRILTSHVTRFSLASRAVPISRLATSTLLTSH